MTEALSKLQRYTLNRDVGAVNQVSLTPSPIGPWVQFDDVRALPDEQLPVARIAHIGDAPPYEISLVWHVAVANLAARGVAVDALLYTAPPPQGDAMGVLRELVAWRDGIASGGAIKGADLESVIDRARALVSP